MFEDGAAWAIKQSSAIGLAYKNYDTDVPKYLQSMLKVKIDCSSVDLTRDRYINVVKMLNSIIKYLNRNYIDDNDKRSLLPLSLPNGVELKNDNERLEDFFNKELLLYWTQYVIDAENKNNS